MPFDVTLTLLRPVTAAVVLETLVYLRSSTYPRPTPNRPNPTPRNIISRSLQASLEPAEVLVGGPHYQASAVYSHDRS